MSQESYPSAKLKIKILVWLVLKMIPRCQDLKTRSYQAIIVAALCPESEDPAQCEVWQSFSLEHYSSSWTRELFCMSILLNIVGLFCISNKFWTRGLFCISCLYCLLGGPPRLLEGHSFEIVARLLQPRSKQFVWMWNRLKPRIVTFRVFRTLRNQDGPHYHYHIISGRVVLRPSLRWPTRHWFDLWRVRGVVWGKKINNKS